MVSFFNAILNKIGIVILPLSGQYIGVVKPLRKAVDVYFTNHSRLVSGMLQLFGNVILIPVKSLQVIYFAIDKTVLAC